MALQPAPGIALPSDNTPKDNNNNNNENDDPDPDAPIISDVLGRSRTISIFASLARDVDSVASRLQDSGLNTTVLAPANAAMAALPRKPWEDAQDYSTFGTQAYSGSDGEGRAQRNLKKFVEAHVIPRSPWAVGDKVAALAGNTVWVEETADGVNVIQPAGIEVLSVADKVSNGEVWIVKGVLEYAR